MDIYKKTVDEYYSQNWVKLVNIAKRLLGKLKRSDVADSLVTESYLYVIEKREVLEDMVISGKIEGIIVQFMNMQTIWRQTKFQKAFIEPDLIDKEINVDPEWEEVDEWELDHDRDYKILMQVVEELDEVDKRLFELAIAGPYNTSGKLAAFVGLSRTAAHYMIRNLKTKLRTEIDARRTDY